MICLSRFVQVVLLALLFVLGANAQTSSGGFPIPADSFNSSLRSSASVPVVHMPDFDLAEDTASDNNELKCTRKFAHKFKVALDVKSQGLLTRSGDVNVWRLIIKSDGAYSINLIFSDFILPVGARLFLYTPSMNQMLGAYDHHNNTSHKFAISPIDGDEMVLQYEEPADCPVPASLVIESINHAFQSLRLLPDIDVSASCHNNALVDLDHSLQRQSSVLFIVNGDTYCSGNLINNTSGDGTPYVITSAHCYFVRSGYTYKVDTSLVHTTVTFFNYTSPGINWNISGTRNMSLSGASVAAYRDKRDMMLIRLLQTPPAEYMPYYAGWNIKSTISAPVYDFHHPKGDVTKISYDEDVPAPQSFTCDGLFESNGHWMIYRWDEGITETGSSGSALFDANNHIVGALSGGNTNISCNITGYDDFWRLNVAWNDSKDKIHNLMPFLDPLATSTSRIDGFTPYSQPCYRLTNRSLYQVPEYGSRAHGYPVGSNNLGNTEFAERFVCGQKSTLYGVFFYPEASFFSMNNPVTINVYSGADGPDSLICSNRLLVQSVQYDNGYDTFVSSSPRQWSKMENYFRFPVPVFVDSSFFVSISIEGRVARDSFSLCHTSVLDNDTCNTAFFKNKSGEWKPYILHPDVAGPISIMMDAVVRPGLHQRDSVDVVVPEIDSSSNHSASLGDYYISPNPVVDKVGIFFPEDEVLKNVRIFDYNGRLKFKKDNVNHNGVFVVDVSPFCSDGVYVIEADFEFETRQFKFVFQK